MRKVDLNNPRNKELIEKLKEGTGLHTPGALRIGEVKEIYYNLSKSNYFINAIMPKRSGRIVDGKPDGEYFNQKAFVSAY